MEIHTENFFACLISTKFWKQKKLASAFQFQCSYMYVTDTLYFGLNESLMTLWLANLSLSSHFQVTPALIVQGPVFVGVLFSWIFRKSRDFDHDVKFTSVLAVSRKWNVAGVYLHLLYNMRSKQILLLPNIQKSSFCSQNSDVYICKRTCIFLVTVWRHIQLWGQYYFCDFLGFVVDRGGMCALKNSLIHTHEKWTLPVL